MDAPAMNGSATVPLTSSDADGETVLIRLPLARPLPGPRKRKSRAKKRLPNQNGLGWSDEEHERFLRGLEIYPTGPWKTVASFIGTRTTRQVMTHAQKYRQKIMRRQRGLQIPARKPSSSRSRSNGVPGEHTQQSIKTGKTSAPIKPITAATSRLLLATSPSSADQTMSGLNVQLPSALASKNASAKPHVSSYGIASDLAMTEAEFRLATDELYAEARWADQFENDDERFAALMEDIVDDPLVLMFQDPSNFSFEQSTTTPTHTFSLWTPMYSALV